MFRRPAERFVKTTLLVTGVALVLAGCGRSAPDSSAEATAGATPKALRNRNDADSMVAAVSAAGKPGAPVEMKFDILERPEAGRVLPINIDVTPRGADIKALEVTFQSSDGIEVVSGAMLDRVEKPVDGAAIQHEIRVMPRRDGVFYISVVAQVETAAGSIARSFAIPVIVGGGAAASAAVAGKPGGPASTVDGSGQPIIPMPAQETSGPAISTAASPKASP